MQRSSSWMHSFEVSNGRTGLRDIIHRTRRECRHEPHGLFRRQRRRCGRQGRIILAHQTGTPTRAVQVFPAAASDESRQSGLDDRRLSNGSTREGDGRFGRVRIGSRLPRRESPVQPPAMRRAAQDSALKQTAGAPALRTAGSVESGSDVAAWPRSLLRLPAVRRRSELLSAQRNDAAGLEPGHRSALRYSRWRAN